MRIAQEINLQYTDTSQIVTRLTISQTMIHNHYAKTIRNPIAIRTMLIAATVTKITAVSMTMTVRYTAMTQASNDNQRHLSASFLKKHRQGLMQRKQCYASVPLTIT